MTVVPGLDPATALPRGAAYVEALQSPQTAFADPDLAHAAPALTPLGLPRPVSGNFASVFRLEAPDGRTWAVRCFVRWFDDMARRYTAIDQHLRKLPAETGTWRVGFEFQERGVQVNGDWFPIVKMEWASGKPLLAYIEEHLWDSAALAYLAVRFATLVDELRRSGVAHGDLQHGNILVAPGGALRLVDYDGMFVPPLAGLTGNELGHRNYQHPGRQPGEFGLHLDNFASWVIYASIVGLSADPLLWGRLDGGDECLLFRSQDFADPANSEALAAFESTGDPVLADLAGRLRQFLRTDFAAVPPLSPDRAPLPAAKAPDNAVDLSRQRSLMAALRDDRPAAAPAVEDVRPSRRHATPEAVVFAHMQKAKAVFAGLFAAVLVVLGLSITGALPLVVGVVLVGAMGAGAYKLMDVLWQGSPEVAGYRAKQAARDQADRSREAAQAALERLQQERAEVDRAEQEARRRAGQASEDAAAGSDAAVREIDDALRKRLAELAAQEQALYREEHNAAAAVLRAKQQVAINEDLRTKPLSMFSGLNDRVLYALALDDVRTAADFVDVAVENEGKSSTEVAHLVRADGHRVRATGLTAGSARQLLSWRRSLEARLSASLPTRLSDEESAAIRTRFADQRAALAGAEESAKADAACQAAAVRAMPRADAGALAEAARRMQKEAADRRVKLDQELGRAKKALAEAAWEADEAACELEAYLGLTFAAFLKAVFQSNLRRA